jgi:hypothetical protein
MTIAVLAVVIGLCATARAYPQFQFATGATRCSECHLAAGGGGLLTDYGHGEVGDTISRDGDGSFAHGAWQPPDWLALGADLRAAVGGKRLDGETPTVLAFPMQADISARAAFGPVSFNVVVGLNGAARGRPAGASVINYFASRQHFVAYQPDPTSWSVRVGRFFPTVGVRTQDHTAYPRRHLGMYLLEEPYALELAIPRGRWDGFVAVTAPNPVAVTGAGTAGFGGSAYVERQIGDGAGAIAGQARVVIGDSDRRIMTGAVGKRWLPGPKLLALAEVDVQRQSIADGGFTRWQAVGYLSVTRMMLPGFMIGAAIQRFAPDVSFRGTTRNAVELNLQAFPWAHVEAHLLTRAEATGGDTGHPNLLALLQLHYFL